jgi:hypothetical protein
VPAAHLGWAVGLDEAVDDGVAGEVDAHVQLAVKVGIAAIARDRGGGRAKGKRNV